MRYLDMFIMMIFSVFIWSAVTITFVKAEIFKPIKQGILKITPRVCEDKIATLLYCSQCLGFWVGIIGTFVIYPVWIKHVGGPVITAILHGFCISLSSMLIERILYGIKAGNTGRARKER